MCPGVDPLSPGSWNESCATRKCANCPKPSFSIPAGRENETVTFSLWMTGDVDRRRKFGLFNVSKTAQQLADGLPSDLNNIIDHIFTAGVCWAKCCEDTAQLEPDVHIISFEDYQRNVIFLPENSFLVS